MSGIEDFYFLYLLHHYLADSFLCGLIEDEVSLFLPLLMWHLFIDIFLVLIYLMTNPKGTLILKLDFIQCVKGSPSMPYNPAHTMTIITFCTQ